MNKLYYLSEVIKKETTFTIETESILANIIK